MTTITEQKIGRKEITPEMITGFSSALEKLETQEPNMDWSATSLIKKHAEQVNILLEKGYKTTQIADILKSELGLDISSALIRRALNKTSQEETNH